MKVFSQNLSLPRITLLLVFLLSFVFLAAESNSDFIVKNLKIEDVPNDDGSGLKLSWTPLPKDARILEYRVYRGASPDSLFFIGKIDINVKTGFAGDRVYYSDKGWTGYVDCLDIVGTGTKVEKEKKQGPDSPLYKRAPRNAENIANDLNHYRLLAQVPYKSLYLKSEPVVKGEDTLAKVKIYQNNYILKKLIPGHTYYYAVIAVNEARKFYPHSEIVAGVPKANAPEMPKKFNSVLVKEDNMLKFEWAYPIESSVIGAYEIYAIPNDKVADFQASLVDTNVVNPVIPLWMLQPGGSNVNFAEITYEDFASKINNENADPTSYQYVFAYAGYTGERTFSEPITPKVISKSDLPNVPRFFVRDLEGGNDIGDYNEIYWDEPVVYLTQSTYANNAETKVLVNYEYEIPSNFTLHNIYFDAFVDGQKVDSVNEFYQDKNIVIEIPKKDKAIDRIHFEITLKVTGSDLPKDYKIEQDLLYDTVLEAFKPTSISISDIPQNKYSYKVLRQNYFDAMFSENKKTLPTQRTYNDAIDFPQYEYQLIQGAEDKSILLSSNIEIFDEELGKTVVTSIFKEAASKVEDPNLNSPLLNKINKLDGKKRIKALIKEKYKHKRSYRYKMIKTDGEGSFVVSEVFKDGNKEYFYPIGGWFKKDKLLMLIASLLFAILVFVMVDKAKKGQDLYVRPIAGIQEIDNAIGRATEMGKPILFVPGLSGIQDVATLAGLAILGRVAKKAAEYDTKILCPVRDYIVLPIAQETIKEAHYEAGRPDSFDPNSAFFITSSQFAFVAGVNGVMIREETATNFYMGMFWAEALIMTETGNATGAIQISGTDAVTQIPFFITTCDYTLIGEELYAASAYLAREPLMLGTLKAQDYFKFIILVFVILGTILSTAHLTFLINMFPEK